MPTAPGPTTDPQLEAFGYECRRCLRCCHEKRIQVNPYEIARLARRRGTTTTQFIAAFTQQGAGTALSQTETGACVFLGPEGCTVHPDRPLVCRLYPLGRHRTADGTVSFSHLEPHPQTEGRYSSDGTIAQFLAAQQADPFIQAADDYFFWLCRANEIARSLEADGAGDTGEADAGDPFALHDLDVAVRQHCAARSIAEPQGIEERRQLHLLILEGYLTTLSR